MAVTSHDVARLAGVSQATVSRALRDDARVTAATRARVRQAAATLGYVPSELGRGLSTRTTRPRRARRRAAQHALPPADGPDPRRARRARLPHVAARRARRRVGDRPPARSLRRRGDPDDHPLSATRCPTSCPARGLPFVFLNRLGSLADAPSVSADNVGRRRGRRRAACSSGGHRDIGVLLGPADTSTSRDREAGLPAGVRATPASPWSSAQIVRGEFDHESGRVGVRALVDAAAPPTAVLCANDHIAIGALSEAAELGRRVPDELAVVGFDDIDMAVVAGVPPHHRAQPLARDGRARRSDAARRDRDAPTSRSTTWCSRRRSCCAPPTVATTPDDRGSARVARPSPARAGRWAPPRFPAATDHRRDGGRRPRRRAVRWRCGSWAITEIPGLSTSASGMSSNPTSATRCWMPRSWIPRTAPTVTLFWAVNSAVGADGAASRSSAASCGRRLVVQVVHDQPRVDLDPGAAQGVGVAGEAQSCRGDAPPGRRGIRCGGGRRRAGARRRGGRRRGCRRARRRWRSRPGRGRRRRSGVPEASSALRYAWLCDAGAMTSASARRATNARTSSCSRAGSSSMLPAMISTPCSRAVSSRARSTAAEKGLPTSSRIAAIALVRPPARRRLLAVKFGLVVELAHRPLHRLRGRRGDATLAVEHPRRGLRADAGETGDVAQGRAPGHAVPAVRASVGAMAVQHDRGRQRCQHRRSVRRTTPLTTRSASA